MGWNLNKKCAKMQLQSRLEQKETKGTSIMLHLSATTTFPFLDSMNKEFATNKIAVEKENSDFFRNGVLRVH